MFSVDKILIYSFHKMSEPVSTCQYCNNVFNNKYTLKQHQKTAKFCLEIQGNIGFFNCEYCSKNLSTNERLHTHYNICKEKQKIEATKDIKSENENLKQTIRLLEEKLKDTEDKYEEKLKDIESKYEEKISDRDEYISKLEEKLQKFENVVIHQSKKSNTVNHTTNNIIVNNNPITNEVLRQCATTFSIDNAYNIDGIAKHLTNSLEDHITCTDPSRSIFKYTNEKDEEIVDQNLEILLPQYLNAVKDRNNFLYKEVFEYFEKNNVSLDIKTDYQVFYNALNSIIEKNGHSSKYTEKCKQKMVRECKKRFLEKNKNKDKTITKELSIEEVMINVIETGGSVHDFVDRYFRFSEIDIDDETDEQFAYRREMEDLFIKKRREWRLQNEKREKEV